MKIALPQLMQKFKTPLVVSLSAAIVAVVVYFLLRSSAGVFTAIPKSTVAVIEIRNWNVASEKLSSTLIGAAMKKTDIAQKLNAEISTMQQLLKADKSLMDAIATSTVASLHLTTADDYGLLFTTELKGVNDNTLLNRVQSSPLVRKVGVRIFKNQKIIETELRNGRLLSFAKVNNVLAFSFTSFLTENSVTATLTNENLQGVKEFKSVRVKNSSADVVVYFNCQNAQVILPVSIKADKVGLLGDIKKFGDWACYEIRFGKEQTEIIATAVSLSEENALNNEASTFSTLLGNIPDNAAYVNMCSQKSGNPSAILESYFSEWAGSVKVFVITEPFNENFSEQNLFIVETRSRAKAISGLKKLMIENGDNTLPVDTFGNNEVYFLKDGSAVQQYFGNALVNFTQCYFSVTDKVVMFAQNADAFQLALEKIAKGETLNRDVDFLNSGKGILNDYTGMFYLHPQRAEMLTKALLKGNSTMTEFLSAQKSILQFTKTKNGKTTASLFLKPGTQQQASAGLLWKTKLLATSLFTPQLITNQATGEKEIFVQDTLHNIYLMNQSGQILFTKSIAEPVRGKVEQIDYYNNGSQQIIFASSHHIFILDRAGNDIGSFPLHLTAESRSGISVVNEGSKSRYYVSCSNGNIYGYEVNGKPLPGFSPLSGVGVIENPLHFFTDRGKVLLLVQNIQGSLMLFDSQGKRKWKADNLAAAQSFSVFGKPVPFFINAVGDQLIEISADGNDKLKPLMDSADFFSALPITDTSYNYFFSRKNQLRGYNNYDEFMAALSFTSPILSLKTITIAGKWYLLVKNSEMASLLDADLKKLTSFQFGSGSNNMCITKFSSQNRFVALTTTTDGYISCYRLP